jgi:hypothetical protein
MTLEVSVRKATLYAVAAFSLFLIGSAAKAVAQTDKPNIVVLMTDDTGWGDFGAYSLGSLTLGHPTPNVDRLHQLVRAGKLHRGACFVYHRAHSYPHCAVCSSRAWRRELPAQRHADHC